MTSKINDLENGIFIRLRLRVKILLCIQLGIENKRKYVLHRLTTNQHRNQKIQNKEKQGYCHVCVWQRVCNLRVPS